MHLHSLKQWVQKPFLWLLGKLIPSGRLAIGTDSPFQPLTPTDNAEDIETYSMAMDFAYSPDKRQIRNIAVTGQYGSGKSSFLRTYFKGRKEVLWVSLALFLDHVAEKERDSKEFEHKLELSILQQILHVRKESKWWSWKLIIVLFLIGCGLIGVIQPDALVKYVSENVHVWVMQHAAIIFWGSCVELSVVSLLSLRRLLLWGRSLGIKSVNVKGGSVGEVGIELPDSAAWSILNRNIKAIINFFAIANYTTVIFEDIDRFNDLRIFTKLREMNILLNNSEEISEKHKPIRFIYALREELFKDEKSKVKFFDLVIPIIPRINASNSRTEMLSFLHDWSDKKLDQSLKRFVKEISPFISDMRLLKNICNEYFTYREQIVDCTSEEELLGLIVFKNFFPESFALMHTGKGMIWDLMQAKKSAQENLMAEIDRDIHAHTTEIEAIENETIRDVKQLQAMYFATLMREFTPEDSYVSINGNQLESTAIIHRKDWFDLLRGNKLGHGYYGRAIIQWSEIEKKTDPSCSYDQHVARREARTNGRIEKIKIEIQKLRDRRLLVRRKTIQKLIEEETLAESAVVSIVQKYSEDRQDAELMLLLLKNGYLNEKYQYNISIFHEVEGVNSFSDYLFEIGVTRGEDMDWDKKLQNPKALIETLDIHYFATNAIRNFDLCTELLQSPTSEKAKEFWSSISQGQKSCFEFVDGYLSCPQASGNSSQFFSCIMAANPNYIDELIEMSAADSVWPRSFVEKQLGLYIAWLLRQGNSVTPSGTVVEYINETATIPELLSVNAIKGSDELMDVVQRFRLKFKVLDCKSAADTGLLDVVIAKRAYAITEKMIKALLQAKGVSVDGFENRNYSVISNCGIEEVIGYIESEFVDYLDGLYMKLESQQEDMPALLVKVLNRDDLSDDAKARFITKQSEHGRVMNAKDLKTATALNLSVKLDWLQPSWNNAVEVWNRNKDDLSPFWEYVRRPSCYSELSKKNSRGIAWENDVCWAKRMAETEEEKLSTDAMSALLSGMAKGVIGDYSGANATPERVASLVRDSRIKFSAGLYEKLRSHANDSHLVLAAMCIRNFCALYSDGMMGSDEVMKLLASPHFQRRNLPLAVNTLKDVVLENSDLTQVVASMINNGNYQDIDETVLNAVIEFLTPQSLQCKIIMHIGGNVDEIRERLRRMGEPYNKIGEPGSRPQIVKWDGVETFLEFLKQHGIVSSTSEKPYGKIQVNTTQS